MTAAIRVHACFCAAAIATAMPSRAADTCDVATGADVYAAKCALCHSVVENQNGTVGPSLFGVVGRQPAKAPQFAYSASLAALTDAWSTAQLDWFLMDPQTRVPGTYMAFSGLRNDSARAAVICYLGTLRATTATLLLGQ
jgi:cytochrome c